MTENKGKKSTQSKRSIKKKKKKKGFNFFKFLLVSILSLFIFFSVVATGITFAVIKNSPDLNLNEIIASTEPSKIYDDNGTVIDKIITSNKKIVIKYNDIPKNLVNAFVSIEDERFFEHHGIDIKRIAGAFLIDLKNMLQGKHGLQGASTITQQLLKNTLYETRGANFSDKIKRKIQEWYLAPKLEKEVGKDAVMEAYLNTIYLGGRAIGVEAAAEQYFNCHTKDLNLIQCAFIAGLPQSPSVYYPYSRTSRKDPSKYINRTKIVLQKMNENGYISQSEYADAIYELNTDKSQVTQDKTTQTLGKNVIGKASAIDDKYKYEWFSREVIDTVKKDLKKVYNYTDDEIENLLVSGNLQINSTMNKTLQDKTQNILDKDQKLVDLSQNNKSGLVEPQASAVLTDYHTGEVKVIIGGRGNQPALSFNRATRAQLPPGSSIKPLTVYSPAIDSKKATAATMLEDSPLSSDMANKYGSSTKPWQPKNASGTYAGYLGLREALKHSVNIYAVKLEDKIGLSTGAKYGEKFGLKLNDIDKHSIAALALGELDGGTNTFTMANAYGVFGNNGLYTTPRLYTTVKDREGKIILETQTETQNILSPQAAYIMYDLLKGPVTDGTAYRIRDSYESDIPIAGKTGSSTKFKNLWFCGLTPYYSGSVWIENKNDQHIYSSDAAYIFGKIMNEAVKNLPNKEISKPNGIIVKSVDKVSGLLPSSLSYEDPRGNQVYDELFIEGTVPTDVDNIHVSVEINKLNGKLASRFTPSFLTESRVYIKRDYLPGVYLQDEPYVLPKYYDNKQSYTQPDADKNNTTDENTTHNDDENTNDDLNENKNNNPIVPDKKPLENQDNNKNINENNNIINPGIKNNKGKR